MEILKKTIEGRCETEEQVEEVIKSFKDGEIDGGYELTSYTSTHKVKKDDDFYLVKLVQVFN